MEVPPVRQCAEKPALLNFLCQGVRVAVTIALLFGCTSGVAETLDGAAPSCPGDPGDPCDPACDACELACTNDCDAGRPVPGADAGEVPDAGAGPVPDAAARPPCDQTLEPGADVAAAVQVAGPGSVICLDAGEHGRLDLDGTARTSLVTVRSTTERDATLSVDIRRSSGIALEYLTLSGLYTGYMARDITVSNNVFTGQAVLNLGPNGGDADFRAYGDADIVLEGNTFDAISVGPDAYEGRLQVLAGDVDCGVVITRNHFGEAGESDGIQVGGTGLVIGPGNVFDGIVQASYGRHVDAIQLYGASHTTITGNYFVNNSVQIMAPDGGNGEVVTHNVFVGNGEYRSAIQFGSLVGGTFNHNTVLHMEVGFSRKRENTQNSRDVVAMDNIMVDAHFGTGISDTPGSGCTDCTFAHNLVEEEGIGTGSVVGAPTFTGGPAPGTWAGYRLGSSSLGYGAAADETDMGSNYFGE